MVGRLCRIRWWYSVQWSPPRGSPSAYSHRSPPHHSTPAPPPPAMRRLRLHRVPLAMQVHDLDALGAERLGAVPLRVDRREGGEAALLPLPVVADGLGRPDGHRRVAVLEAEHARLLFAAAGLRAVNRSSLPHGARMALLPHRPRPPLAVAERDVRRHARADDAHPRHRRRLPHVRPQRGGVRLPHPARLRADMRLDLAQQRAHVCCRAEVVLPRRRVACARGGGEASGGGEVSRRRPRSV